MPSLIFNSCPRNMARSIINFESDRFGVVLLTSEYIPDKTHTHRSDLTNEVVGDGYSEGGAKVSVGFLDSEDDALDISLGGHRWLNATIAARYAVYYKSNGGSASDDELVAVIDFGRDITSTEGTFALSESTLRLQN